MKYPCPCCGYLVFEEPPGSYDICPICFWEDDIVQLRFPEATGANRVSLVQGQNNFAAMGACEERVFKHVRRPLPEEQREPEWRPVGPQRDQYESAGNDVSGMDYWSKVIAPDYPKASIRLYYWREDYWRARGSPDGSNPSDSSRA